MRRTFFLLALLSAALHAQNCDYRFPARVIAQSGLSLRAAPNLNSDILKVLPARSKVQVCEPASQATIDGLKGHWRPARFNDLEGYLFDAYLTVQEQSGEVKEASSENNCRYELAALVKAPSGLSLRAKPSLNSKKLTVVPFEEKVFACRDKETPLQIGELKGHWRAVTYRQWEGFMFDGYLEISDRAPRPKEDARIAAKKTIQPESSLEKEAEVSLEKHPFMNGASEIQLLTESYNYCGDVKKLDPGLVWYGVYPVSDEEEAHYPLRKVELSIELSKRRLSDALEFDINTDQDDRSLFLIGFNREIDPDKIKIASQEEVLRIRGRQVFPGQEFSLYGDGGGIYLTAAGSVEQRADCRVFQNYQLKVQSGKSSQTLIPGALAMPECGTPEIYWYGDLSGDGVPEIIFVNQLADANVFTLFSSIKPAEGELWRKTATFRVANCP